MMLFLGRVSLRRRRTKKCCRSTAGEKNQAIAVKKPQPNTKIRYEAEENRKNYRYHDGAKVRGRDQKKKSTAKDVAREKLFEKDPGTPIPKSCKREI